MPSLTIRADGSLRLDGPVPLELAEVDALGLDPATTDQNLEALAGAGLHVSRVVLSPDGARTYHVAAPAAPEAVAALESVRGAREALEVADAAQVEARGAYLGALAAAAAAGVSYSELGRAVGVHAATVSNQLRRAGLAPEGPAS